MVFIPVYNIKTECIIGGLLLKRKILIKHYYIANILITKNVFQMYVIFIYLFTLFICLYGGVTVNSILTENLEDVKLQLIFAHKMFLFT